MADELTRITHNPFKHRIWVGGGMLIASRFALVCDYSVPKPKYRVKARRRVISADEYFASGQQWRPGEIIWDHVRRPYGIGRRVPASREWMR